MTGEIAFCPYCGKRTLEGAFYCPYCGKPLPRAEETAPDLKSRAIRPPARESLRGPCALIYAGGKPLEIPRAGRTVAQLLSAPLPDVTRNMKASRGFIASGVPADKAVELAERLEKELDIRVLVLPQSDCLPLPQAMRMREIQIDAAGIRCQAYTWDQTTDLAARWEEVFLVSCARLEVERVSEVEEPRRKKSPNPFDRFVPVLETITRHEFLIDVILNDPWRRLRLDYNTNAYALTESEPAPEMLFAALRACAESLVKHAHSVPMNRGVHLLAVGAGDSDWAQLSFANKSDFDAYTRWLLHLVRYGYAIPEGPDRLG